MNFKRGVTIALILKALANVSLQGAEAPSFPADDLPANIRGQLEGRYGPKENYTVEEILSVETPKPEMFKAKDIKTHFEIIGKLDPAKTHLFDKLVGKFGKKTLYSADEVRAIESPKVPVKKSRGEKEPKYHVDAFSKEEVRRHFELLRSTDPKTKATMETLEKKYPGQQFYSAAQVRDVEKNGAEWSIPDDRPATPVTFLAEKQAQSNRSVFLDGWKTPLVRHDWSDVLSTENAAVSGELAKKKSDDLVGATLSYSHDENASTDTWSTVGAVIWPWVYEGYAGEGLFQHVVVAPSISVNRISTSGDPKTETDQVLYRLGLYSAWAEPFRSALFERGLMTELELRAAPVFGTNTGHEARMPGYEADLEPRWLFNNGGKNQECVYKIGFKNTLLFKSPLLADFSDQSVLDYQIRIWMHVEGGDIQDIGKSFAATPGDFFRLGPVAQLRVNSFFPVPLLSKGLSFTAQYSYLPAIDGPKGHDYLLNLAAALTIRDDKVNHQKLSITASYTDGGLNFTKQDVNTFTLGLSVLF